MAKAAADGRATDVLVDGYDVSYERQEDGRLRSEQLLPDEEVTVTVVAAGYVPKSATLKLAEGAVKELTVRLQIDASRQTESKKPMDY